MDDKNPLQPIIDARQAVSDFIAKRTGGKVERKLSEEQQHKIDLKKLEALKHQYGDIFADQRYPILIKFCAKFIDVLNYELVEEGLKPNNAVNVAALAQTIKAVKAIFNECDKVPKVIK